MGGCKQETLIFLFFVAAVFVNEWLTDKGQVAKAQNRPDKDFLLIRLWYVVFLLLVVHTHTRGTPDYGMAIVHNLMRYSSYPVHSDRLPSEWHRSSVSHNRGTCTVNWVIVGRLIPSGALFARMMDRRGNS